MDRLLGLDRLTTQNENKVSSQQRVVENWELLSSVFVSVD